MILIKGYSDISLALNAEQVDFILVGAYALAAHEYPRATMDIDIWVMPSPANAEAVIRALRQFGSPLHGLKVEDLQSSDTVFQIGVAPRRIDLLTGATGLDFSTASKNAVARRVDGIDLKVLSIDDLIVNKLATGRPKDQVDAAELRKLKGSLRDTDSKK
ncbi:DUF6036 family nucleotidyltransferase [Pontiella sulfatireligans]|uniref:DUF6036 domain-containing protein n=1 Tax=Pontiella sulfatireligans TaxID=2750658 RepID=A0A6C2UMH2_9BACT|nr:DUF6036 family nucleotidyltransferase [Pontiella sulfatireligans]VGO21199.1 hypothetical protein SCARR_03270 [Pontiella sulfatireligans]